MTYNEGKQFVEALIDSEELANRASKITQPLELIELASEIGIDISEDDATDIMNQVMKGKTEAELSEDELELIGGGYLLACAVLGGIFGVSCALLALTIYGVAKSMEKKKK